VGKEKRKTPCPRKNEQKKNEKKSQPIIRIGGGAKGRKKRKRQPSERNGRHFKEKR